jgi:lysozyme family protein
LHGGSSGKRRNRKRDDVMTAPRMIGPKHNWLILLSYSAPIWLFTATREGQRVSNTIDVEQLIDAVIEREGGYVDHPADRGGPTCFGITEAVARAQGFAGPMRHLPRDEAMRIYTRLFWLRPRFDEIARRSPRIAAELFDTGVNMGPAVSATFLQRALTALNRNAGDYPDLVPDGRIGDQTLAAFDAFLKARGQASGETVLLRALEALQGERYLRLAELRPANEAFLYGWLANRIGDAK